MAGPVPAIHALLASRKSWMPGTRLVLGPAGGRTRVPGMTGGRVVAGVTTSHPLRELGVEPVAQAVAQHVDGEHRERQADAREENVVRVDAEEAAAFRHDVAPG